MLRSPLSLKVVIVIAVGVLLVSSAAVGAQADGFRETFGDPELPGWEHPPEAAVVDGLLQVRHGGFAVHFGDWADITLSIRARFSGEGVAAMGYYFRDAGSYTLLITSGALSVQRQEGQAQTSLGSAKVPALLPDTWVDVKIVVSGDRHQVYVNDELQLTVTDAEPLSAGAILLGARGGLTAEYDDLDLRGTPTGAPPEAGPAAQPQSTATAVPPVTTSSERGGLAGLFSELFAGQASRLDLITFLINLALAAVCASILALVYVHWGSSLTNRRKFASNLILMAMTTTFIILVVRSSVALSLGLVGALSIVRFRTAVKEPEELAYLFVAIGIGVGLGDNQRLITLVALAALTAVVFLQRILRRPDADVNMHLVVASRQPHKVELAQITAALRPHVAKMKLLRFDETPDMLETAFLVEFGRMDRLNEARLALTSLSESIEISFMDNKGLW